MGQYDQPGSYFIEFGDKSELNPTYYTNQIPMSQNNTGFAYQCTWFINDRLRQITGFKMESLAGGWGDGGRIWETAQKLGFPVYDANTALAKRGTLAGYIISFESGVKSGYGTHTAVVESYDKESGSGFCSEMWGSVADGAVHLVRYSAAELFHPSMMFIDFSSVGLTAGSPVSADEVRTVYSKVKDDKTYDTLDELQFGRETIKKLLDRGLMVGEGRDKLGLSYNMLRVLVINDRAGLYDK